MDRTEAGPPFGPMWLDPALGVPCRCRCLVNVEIIILLCAKPFRGMRALADIVQDQSTGAMRSNSR
jgi:hypothetical protein